MAEEKYLSESGAKNLVNRIKAVTTKATEIEQSVDATYIKKGDKISISSPTSDSWITGGRKSITFGIPLNRIIDDNVTTVKITNMQFISRHSSVRVVETTQTISQKITVPKYTLTSGKLTESTQQITQNITVPKYTVVQGGYISPSKDISIGANYVKLSDYSNLSVNTMGIRKTAGEIYVAIENTNEFYQDGTSYVVTNNLPLSTYINCDLEFT